MRCLLFLVLLGTVGCASSDDVTASGDQLVVTFERSVSTFEATDLLLRVAPGAEIAGRFRPTTLSTGSMDLPPPAMAEALFDGGAISIDVTRTAAEFADLGFPSMAGRGSPLEAVFDSLTEVNRQRAELPAAYGRYRVVAAFPSTLPTREAERAFEAATGRPPNGVTAHAAELRVVPAGGDPEDLAARIAAVPDVLGVRREG